MDPQFVDQPWTWQKVLSVLAHIWIPVIVIGTAGTASMIRRLRANLLDELQKQYVVTARA
jgi:peptide/nickel transport system permease protein